MNTEKLFTKFYERVTPKLDDAGCWEWTGHITPDGYGRYSLPDKLGNILAHRWAYELFIGPIPDGLTLDHLCRVKTCVNPYHLEPVSARVNVQRAQSNFCKRGHSLQDSYKWHGTRNCRPCHNIRNQAYRDKQKSR